MAKMCYWRAGIQASSPRGALTDVLPVLGPDRYRDPSMNKVGVVEASEASAGTDQPLDNIPQSINHFFTLKKFCFYAEGISVPTKRHRE